MLNFKDYFQFPLKVDDYSQIYVWTDDKKVAFNCLNNNIEEIKEIIGAINGEFPGKYNAEANDGIIYIDGKRKLLIRSWGRLTGIGGYHLPTDAAINVQNDMVEYCVKMLRRNL